MREGRISEIDGEHIAGELEAMGRSERRELINRFAVFIVFLLKWQAQPGLRGNSWKCSLKEKRLTTGQFFGISHARSQA